LATQYRLGKMVSPGSLVDLEHHTINGKIRYMINILCAIFRL